ncbi:MAG: branched-chain amino acid ABC transporter permease [Anaerolineae bacterium]|nr:branched-chain amino acid ABC transporter permease [Anaerolineae bacterium]MDW8101390.1 branched-chain amino acid ABC transporter permease [Anaerolineae bacterium]
MVQKLKSPAVFFFTGALLIFALVQFLIETGRLNAYWQTILFWGAAMTMVSLGLNLIYGFNGQFSLGQFGFYALGAYTSADITWRWVRGDPSGLVVVIGGSILALLFMWGVASFLKRFYGVSVFTEFVFHAFATVAGFAIAVKYLRPLLGPAVYSFIQSLPEPVGRQIVFFLALLGGTAIAGIVSFLFGIPVLTLGSDYLGIATLGFTIIVKVLLDNSDTILPFPEMKGARGMVGIPKWTTWPWVFVCFMFVVLFMRNLLHSSVGRAIVSIKEDERAAALMGIDVARTKILAFVVGSVFAGLAGGIRAHDQGFLHPTMFGFLPSFNPLIIVVFGGLGSMTGTIITGFFWVFLLEGVLRLVLPTGFENWRYVIYPLVLLLLMLLRPQGLMGRYEIPFLRQTYPPVRKAAEAKA